MNAPPKAKVFVEGRYKKLSRDLPQTVFFCPDCKGHPRRRKKCSRCEGFGKLTRDSIQELVGWVLGKAFGTRKQKFHGAGREDVDVRMLGQGRPFVFELINPKTTTVDLAHWESEINRRNEGRLEISGLHWTEKARVRVIKEAKHAKRYRALVSLDEPETGSGAFEVPEGVVGVRRTIQQKTPSRVAHRRADKVRERWVDYESIAPLEDGTLEVVVKCEHGTYVKEAISGEGGSTTPSFGELLGAPCRCQELDVLEILTEEGEDEAPEPQRQGQRLAFGTGI